MYQPHAYDSGTLGAETTCEQDKIVLSDNINSLRASMVNAKRVAMFGIPAALVIGWLIGKK